MSTTDRPNVNDPRFPDAEAAIWAWREVAHIHRRRLTLVVLAVLVAIIGLAVAVL